MNITEPKINDYMTRISLSAQLSKDDRVLRDMEAYARENDFPIIGPLVGRFLRQLALITGARRIFEMGSGYGYSAVWFAGGMSDNSKIICTDGSQANKELALDYFERAGYNSKIEFHTGDAKDIFREFNGPFDIILNDIDKEQYPEAFDLAVLRLKKGGLFITDNVLWSGRVLDDAADEETRGILEFNRKLFESEAVFSSIIPIRDGLGLAVKL